MLFFLLACGPWSRLEVSSDWRVPLGKTGGIRQDITTGQDWRYQTADYHWSRLEISDIRLPLVKTGGTQWLDSTTGQDYEITTGQDWRYLSDMRLPLVKAGCISVTWDYHWSRLEVSQWHEITTGQDWIYQTGDYHWSRLDVSQWHEITNDQGWMYLSDMRLPLVKIAVTRQEITTGQSWEDVFFPRYVDIMH